MFQIVSGERKRRTMSPATFVASLAAHLLLLGGVLHAAGGERPPREVLGTELLLPPMPEETPPPPVEPVEPPPPAAAPADQPLPVPGERLELAAPAEAPDGIVEEAPDVRPVDDRDFRDGRPGDVIGTPHAEHIPLTGNTNDPGASDLDEVIDASMAERRPVLDRRGLDRAMERHYPPMLRDARVHGTVLVELVVEADGRVRPGSPQLMDASHPAFGEAALRAAERFRFTPAEVGGVRVPVRVTIPISWSVPR